MEYTMADLHSMLEYIDAQLKDQTRTLTDAFSLGVTMWRKP